MTEAQRDLIAQAQKCIQESSTSPQDVPCYYVPMKHLDALEALLSVDPGLGAPPQHEHYFEMFSVCRRCGQTEAAIDGCHHCNEPQASGRCWWCLKPQSQAALPSRVVPPDSGTVADVRAALGASLSNELAEAVLESRVVPPEPPPSYAEVAHKQSTGELLTRRLSVNDAEAQGNEPERAADQRSVSTIRPSAPDSDLDRLLRQARSASEGTTRYINDLGLALAHARETRPQDDLLAAFDLSVAGVHLLDGPRPSYEFYDKAEWHTRGIRQGLKIARTILVENLKLTAAGGSSHAPHPPY